MAGAAGGRPDRRGAAVGARGRRPRRGRRRRIAAAARRRPAARARQLRAPRRGGRRARGARARRRAAACGCSPPASGRSGSTARWSARSLRCPRPTPSRCSRARHRRAPSFALTADRRRPSPGCAAPSTASRWRSSWPPPAPGSSPCRRSWQRLDDRFALLADPVSDRRAHARRRAGLELRPALPRRPARAVGARAVPRRGDAARGRARAGRARRAGRAALDVVERLVDRSLVIVDDRGPGHPLPAPRQRPGVRRRPGRRGRRRRRRRGRGPRLGRGRWPHRRGRVRGPDQAALVARHAPPNAPRSTPRSTGPAPTIRSPGLRIAVGFGWAWVLLDDTAAAARLRAARLAAGGARRRSACRPAPELGSRPCRATCGRPAPRSTPRSPLAGTTRGS